MISNAAAFKPSALADLYKNAKHFSFHLYAVERGAAPLGDDDVEETKSNNSTAPTNVNITISGNQNSVAAFGSTIRDVENHLEAVQQTNPDIARVLKEFAEAVQMSDLSAAEMKNVFIRIDDLAEQISKKPEKEKHFLILDKARAIVEYIVTVVSINHGVHYLMAHSDKVLGVITATFGA